MCLFFLPPWFQMKNPLSFELVFICNVSLAAFNTFYLWFRNAQLWCVLISFILFGIHSVSWICKFVFFTKFGKFSATASLNTISVYSLSSLPLGLQQYNYKTWWSYPTDSWILLNLLFNLFGLGEFYWSALRFTASILFLHCATETSQQDFKIFFYSIF